MDETQRLLLETLNRLPRHWWQVSTAREHAALDALEERGYVERVIEHATAYYRIRRKGQKALKVTHG